MTAAHLMNAADHTVVHAIGALITGLHEGPEDVRMFVDIVRQALPHTGDQNPNMAQMLCVAMHLIELPASSYFGGSEWCGWRYRAACALKAHHRYATGQAQDRMNRQILERRCA
jgi:hypothetical protein